MKSRLALIVFVLLVVGIVGVALAQLQTAQVAPHEEGTKKIMYIESGEVLYNMHWQIDQVEKNNKKLLHYRMKGDNNKQGSERIDWNEESMIEITDQGLRSQYWKKTSTGAEQMSWRLVYNWANRTVNYSFTDRATGKTDSKIIEFDANAIPGDCMELLLRGFPFEKGPGTRFTGQIIGSDGSLLGGHMIYRGEEVVQTTLGSIPAYKIELKPTGALGLVAPDMFMWFAKKPPHVWLRFDGRDNGLTKPRTKTVLTHFKPAEYVAP